MDPWAKYSTDLSLLWINWLFSDFTQTMFEPRCEMCRYIPVSLFYFSYTLKLRKHLVTLFTAKVEEWFNHTGSKQSARLVYHHWCVWLDQADETFRRPSSNFWRPKPLIKT